MEAVHFHFMALLWGWILFSSEGMVIGAAAASGDLGVRRGCNLNYYANICVPWAYHLGAQVPVRWHAGCIRGG